MKHLVYTTLGFDSSYVGCLDFLIDSINQKNLDTPNFDFLVICDRKLYKDVLTRLERRKPSFLIKFMILENAPTKMLASINKLKVFEYPFITEYDNIFFLDADIIVTMNMGNIINKSLDANTLYVFKEKDDYEEHKNMFWSLGKNTDREVAHFKEKSIYPFNAGCFILKNSKEMKSHFSIILDFIKDYQGAYFYEQSFMNDYFNRIGNVSYSIINNENYVMFPDENQFYDNKIIHFCGFPGNGERKVKVMQTYWNKFMIKPVQSITPRKKKIL